MSDFELIPLYRRGIVVAHAKVDVLDAARLRSHRWGISRRCNDQLVACRWIRKGGRRAPLRAVLMHREILGISHLPSTVEGDHANRDTLDNRRQNLRVLTRAQNMQNRGSYRGSTSPHRGVSLERSTGRWCAHVKRDGRVLWFARFDSEDEAACAAAAKRRELLPFTTEEAPSGR